MHDTWIVVIEKEREGEWKKEQRYFYVNAYSLTNTSWSPRSLDCWCGLNVDEECGMFMTVLKDGGSSPVYCSYCVAYSNSLARTSGNWMRSRQHLLMQSSVTTIATEMIRKAVKAMVTLIATVMKVPST